MRQIRFGHEPKFRPVSVLSGLSLKAVDDLASALQDKDLTDRVRDKATSESAIQAGTAILSMLGGGGRAKRPLNFVRPKGGHHWVPAEARKVFERATSGKYGESHYFDGPHREYNRAVQELWNKNKYNPSKMTTEDAEDFIRQIERSRDPRIAPFRKMILRKAKKYNRELREGTEQ